MPILELQLMFEYVISHSGEELQLESESMGNCIASKTSLSFNKAALCEKMRFVSLHFGRAADELIQVNF